ncbi:unnamed protein product [Somion occarium]|uniref:Uncharacterized protein n=1 Tax=Somion occarium TaxID=3059160 RepID=A0ABP1EC74_9APHY
MRGLPQPAIEEFNTGGKYIAILNLAREHNLTDILPWCLYACAQLSWETLVQGVITPRGQKEKLSEDDLVRCLKGREELICDSIHSANTFNDEETACFGGDCANILDQMVDICISAKEFINPDPLGITADGYQLKNKHLCRKCVEHFTKLPEIDRKVTFEKLPKYFGLTH